MNIFKLRHSISRRVFKLINFYKFDNIGKKSFIFKPILLNNTQYISLGNKVEIWNFARIECISKWGKQNYTPKLIIGDNTIINQNCHITCASKIEIGENVGISHGVTITDISHKYDNLQKSSLDQGIDTKPVKIEDYATIGANAVILRGVTIGKHAVIGANAVVTKDIPPYSVAVGVPAKVLKILK